MVIEKWDSTELMGRLSLQTIRRGAVHYMMTLLRVPVPFISFRSWCRWWCLCSLNLPATWVLVPVLILMPVIVYRWLGCRFRGTGFGPNSGQSLHAPRAPVPARVLSCRIRCRCDRLLWRLCVWAGAGFEVRVKIRMSRWVPMVFNDYWIGL